jgi:glyoxylase-like metal-dependent hydrolase (beta-lactamase superfamily II)
MYEIYALKGGEREAPCPTVLLHTDYGKTTKMAYYFFCLKGNDHTMLIDTGISLEELKLRGITGVPTRQELLSRIDVRPEDIDTIILTHVHGDHFAQPEIYPNCIFYLQRKEFDFWSGDVQRFHNLFCLPFNKDVPGVQISTLQQLNFQERVRVLDGDTEIYPGIRALWWGAHTPGSQVVVVETARGTVLYCADFFDIYRNMEERIPVGMLTSLEEWMNGMGKLELMHLPKESIIPGHDPQLMTMFPKVAEDVVKIA